MCTTSNLTTLTYWQHSEGQPLLSVAEAYSKPHILQDKFIRKPMFLVNSIAKPELYATYVSPEKVAGIKSEDASSNESCGERVKKPGSKKNANGEAKLRPYSCEQCGKSFLLKHHLTTHARTHTGIRPHVCTHCGKTFTHKHCLNTHLLLHSSQRPYQCVECKKSFTLKHHLLTHTRVHSREKPFVCSECGRSFPLKRHLVTHSKFHAGERPYVCEECGESFAQKEHLVMHSRFHGSLNSFACHDCGATFTRKFELVNHGRLHGRQPHFCPLCEKEFLQKRTLVNHMKYHSGDSPFVCTRCGESFLSKSYLQEHVKTHAGTPSRPLICHQCGSAFNNPEALALHVKLHTGDTSLVTDLCALTANLQSANFGNINTATGNNYLHSNAGVPTPAPPIAKPKNHICEYCSKAFSAKHGLQQHNRRHPDGTCALRSHICPTCNKGFYQKNHLLLHQRQHMDPSARNPALNKDFLTAKCLNNPQETSVIKGAPNSDGNIYIRYATKPDEFTVESPGTMSSTSSETIPADGSCKSD